ncbi:MAG: hypothetical protein JNK46_13960 [Methylobacteriaceae bacterium]|nr:hypothetical protein [Methylobacteriaceae bacterium]
MSVAATSAASRLEAALAAFAAVTARRLPAARCDEMVAAACLIGAWTQHPDGADVGGALCADGTPIEASLNFDAQGRVETRLVTDVAAGVAATDFAARRAAVAARCRAFAGEEAAALVEDLAATHLAELPASTRALAFLGAGASAARPLHRMFYFSFAGLTARAVEAQLAGRIDAAIVTQFQALARRLDATVMGVGYDIEAGRCVKAQLYARFSCDAATDLRARVAPAQDEGVARAAGLLSTLLAPMRAATNDVFLGFGVAMSPGAPPRIGARLNCALAPHGVTDFAAVDHALAPLAGRWRAAPDLTGLADAFMPTMLSAGATGGERVAVYFKPQGLAPRRG